jgi:1-deoxy-D-xylulose-5-phosphate synthase
MQVVSEVPVEKGKWEELYPMQERTVIAVGNMVETSMTPARETGAGLINARCIKPMDEDMIMRLSTVAKRVVVVEDGIDVMGKEIALRLPGIEVVRLHVPEELVQHATVAEQRVLCGLTSDDIYRAINGA